MRRFAFFALFLSFLAHADPPPDQWYTVLLDGRKIGSFETTRQVRDGRVITAQILDLSIERAGNAVALTSRETSEETIDGKPLAFRSQSKLSGSETTIEGTVRDGKVEVKTVTGGAVQQRQIAWPNGALMPEGLRLAGLRAGLEPGTMYRSSAFQPSSLDAAEIQTRIGKVEAVDLPEGERSLSTVEQKILFGNSPVTSHLWVDAEQNVHKLTMPVIGVELVLLACDRACATAPNQGTDIFDRTLMPSPRALTRAELRNGMRYVLAARDGGAALNLPETGEQKVLAKNGTLVVDITPSAREGIEDAPDAIDFAPNDWLQSKSPDIEALAKKAVGNVTDPLARMHRLETFVSGFITNKSLGVGYASALEVARKPEGDCTEHAVLLAALGRSLGIATRVVDGLAYAPGFAGKEQVFVPHAWVQAWIDNRWQSFDAALQGFDAGHIALAVGDGDPWRFYSGLDTLGRVELRSAEPLGAVEIN
ncbi:MAG: transglutaminase domain-containing protein [Rhodanobacteraceae bacterium]